MRKSVPAEPIAGFRGRLEQRLQLALLAIAAIALVYVLAAGGAIAERKLAVDVSSAQAGGLQVYFDVGKGFSEEASGKQQYPAGASRILLPLPDARLLALRIDPDPTASALRIAGIAIDVPSTEIEQALPLTGLRPLNQIASVQRTGGAVVVQPASGGNDPQLFLPVEDGATAPDASARGLMNFAQLAVLFAVSGLVVLRLAGSRGRLPIPAMLAAAWMLVAAMAMTSTTSRSVHPDEYNHVAAASYYLNNWIPPAVDDPRIAASYSGYGTTYLDELDVVYLIAAKTSTLWAGARLDPVSSLRLFNVLLFAALVLVAGLQRQTWPGLAVLLLTPQLWYVFSYFNADALPFFLSMVAVLLLAAKDSPVSRFVEGERVPVATVVLFVLAVGLLLVSKRNFLPVVFFIGLLLTGRHLGLSWRGVLVGAVAAALLLFKLVAGAQLADIFPAVSALFAPVGFALLAVFAGLCLWPSIRAAELRPKLARVALVFLAALLVAAPRIAADLAINGSPSEKSAKMQVAQERHAELALKPSTLAGNLGASSPGLHLAAKGVPLSQLLGAPYHWLEISWRSLLGVYGYMTVWAPPPLYWLLGAGWLLLTLGLVRRREPPAGIRGLGIATVACMALVALSSLVHSWANDLQAQGRYLLPGLAMLAAYLLSQPGLLRTRWVAWGMGTCFVGAVLSFALVALPALAGR